MDGAGRQDLLQIVLGIGLFVNDGHGGVRFVFREIPDTVDAQFGHGRLEDDLDIGLLAGDAVSVHEGVLQPEIICAQDKGGFVPLEDPEFRRDVENALRCGVQGEFLGTNPAGAFPGGLAGIHQTSLETGLRFMDGTVPVPDLQGDAIALFRLECDAAIGDAVGTAVRDFAGVPERAAVAVPGDGQAVSGLALSFFGRFHFPTEDGVPVFNGEGPVGVLDFQVCDAGLGGD